MNEILLNIFNSKVRLQCVKHHSATLYDLSNKNIPEMFFLERFVSSNDNIFHKPTIIYY